MSGNHLASSNAQGDKAVSRAARSYLSLLIVFCLFLAAASKLFAQTAGEAARPRSDVAAPVRTPQVYTREGVSVEFGAEPTASGAKEPVASTDTTIRFKVTDANARKPIGNLRPLAWLDRGGDGRALDERTCREK